MSLISQNALRSNKREEEEERIPAAEENGSPFAVAANELQEEPEMKRSRKNSRKRSRRDSERKEQEQEMKSLESALFGTLYSPPEFGKEDADDGTKEEEEKEKQTLPVFFTDKSGGYVVSVYEEDVKKKPDGERKPVWVDEDDAAIEVDIEKVPRLRKLREFKDEKVISGAKFAERLRAQHRKLNPGTDWALLDRKVVASDDESANESDVTGDDVIRSNYELVEKSGVKLLPGVLEYSRLVDANAEEPSSGPINSVEFHQNGQLLLAAGLDKKLRFSRSTGGVTPRCRAFSWRIVRYVKLHSCQTGLR
ncbi:U3 small nucleolar RNA-associated protein 18-like protein [Iris pallida]|uniref:U3 small nucleolar RNA-associated protein 18-like protein n=1 Tax=Iris pallida TaxID=29817 RepID=A0AAX6I269_IRIPA|nr:U3 small nucleolar RNA-associated protein 18-like protein [Iris pallida]